MLQLQGPPALSDFRLAKLLDRLSTREAAVSAVSAQFVHFVDLRTPLGERERAVLEELLTYGPRAAAAAPAAAAESVLVVPRIGTISPWSSKASDIARVCGLEAVSRIERGIAYGLHAARPLGRERLAQLAPLLHDRMTEDALLDAADAQRLFEQPPPRPLARVSLAGGRAALQAADQRL